MIELSRALSGVLLATTAAFAGQSALGQTLPAAVADSAAPRDVQAADVEAAQTPADDQAVPTTPGDETEVEAVVVRGRYIPEPMRATSEVASFLQAEDLERQGDDTAAAALTRVTGLSLAQGRFVYVRGLGERYSSALLNGSPLPSPEPLQRVVPLDLFPSSILEGVVVQKTYSPDFPGEFGGGVIDLQTVSVPRDPFLTLQVGGGVNTETSFRPGLVYFGSDTDRFGFDNGTRDVPTALKDAIATGKRVSQGNFTGAELQRIGQSFENAPLNLIERNNDMPPNGSVEVAGGRSFDTRFGALGVVAVLGYDNSWQTRRGKQQEGDIDIDRLLVQTDYDFVSTQQDIVWNGLLGLGLKTDDHELRFTQLWIRSTTKEARQREGVDFLAGRDVLDSFTEFFERQLFDSQIVGEHDLGDLEVEWRGSYATTSREAPYEKGVRYRLNQGRFFHDASSDFNYTRFSVLSDTVASGAVDVRYDVPVSVIRDASLSAGYAYYDNERDSVSREFRFLALNNALPQGVQVQRPDFLFADFNIGPGGLVLQETTGSQGAGAYDATLRVNAVYAQAEGEIVPRVRAAVGVRFEHATQSVTPRELFGEAPIPAPEPLENSYVLPAATLTWNFAENRQLRFGASKTIARPQFRELAPQQYQDPDSDRLFVGNPFLTDTELLNLDARYEWYFARGQFVTAGLFYKDLDKPVEATVNEAGATVQQTYLNAPRAVLYGLEIEGKAYFDLQTRVAWIDSKRWLAQANYTYGKAEVRVEEGDEVFPLAGAGAGRPALNYILDGSRLQGQSEHLANLQFGFEDETTGTQATLLTTYVSQRTTARGRPGEPDLVQQPGVMLDLVVRQDLSAFGRKLTLALEARNLLDENFEEFQALGADQVDINTYDLGRSFSFSLTARF